MTHEKINEKNVENEIEAGKLEEGALRLKNAMKDVGGEEGIKKTLEGMEPSKLALVIKHTEGVFSQKMSHLTLQPITLLGGFGVGALIAGFLKGDGPADIEQRLAYSGLFLTIGTFAAVMGAMHEYADKHREEVFRASLKNK